MKSQLGWKASIDFGTIEETRVFSSRSKAITFCFGKLPRKFRAGKPERAIKQFLASEHLTGNWSTIEIRKLMDGQVIN